MDGTSSFYLRSETDYGGDDVVFHAPRPRHFSANAIQPWLQVLERDLPRPVSPSLHRVSSPLGQSDGPTSPDSSLSLSSSRFPLSHQDSTRPSTLRSSRMESPARRWVRWMAKMGLKGWIVPSVVFMSLATRWIVGLGGYSGESHCLFSHASLNSEHEGMKSPPLFGDYEAQRHWMEITTHLSFSEWYSYDLLYWGLDYPPLTAYISWICGYM